MMRAVLCLALGGCQLVFPFGEDPVGDDAPPDAASCAQRFNAAAAEVEIDTSDQTLLDPATSADPNEIWLTIPNKNRDIVRITLEGMMFGAPVLASFSDPENDEFDPALTADGRVLLFLSEASVFEVRRTDGDFDRPLERVDLPQQLTGLDVSPDGLRVYYSDNMGIHMVERANLDEPFGNAQDLGIPAGEYPTISPDELEIYYNVDGGIIKRRARTSTANKFDIEEAVFGGVGAADLMGGDAEVDANGTRLYYVVSDEMFFLSRPCP